MTCRYVYHALRNSKHSVATIDEADVVYVYDYCYMMWILSDHHAREHWWLRDNYSPPRKTGSHLLSIYRCAPLLIHPIFSRIAQKLSAFIVVYTLHCVQGLSYHL